MALLAVDLTTHGVVMSADSQRVEIFGGKNDVRESSGGQTRNPIIVRVGGGFVGLVGFAGTEEVEGKPTADWLRGFDAAWPNDDVGAFSRRLRDTLTLVWQRDGLRSVLEILVTGEVNGDVQFWYVRNSQGLRDADWKHNAPSDTFATRNDLDDPDDGYVQRDSEYGETKEELLQRLTYSFRQGVLIPAAPVFDGFGSILRRMYDGEVEGFPPVASLDDLAYFARVRMEFLKRLSSSKHGIYAEDTPTPIGGQVHVYGVGRDGRVCEYRKIRGQVRVLHRGRTGTPETAEVNAKERAYREALRKAAALAHVGYETGTGPTIWARAVRDELALHVSARERFAANTADRESWDRLHGSALMLVVAIDQVQAFEQRIRRLTGGSAGLDKARAKFDAVAADGKKLRDIVAHLDAYAVGEGWRQTGERMPLLKDENVDTFLYWSPSEGTTLDVGGERMNLSDAASAAIDLAEVAEQLRAKALVTAGTDADVAGRLLYGLPPPE